MPISISILIWFPTRPLKHKSRNLSLKNFLSNLHVGAVGTVYKNPVGKNTNPT